MKLDEFETLTDKQLNEVVGGTNVFYQAGIWAGDALYWFAKGASAIKG